MFKEQIGNDLNTSNALTVLFDVLKDNSMNDDTKIYLVESFDRVLSLDLLKNDNDITDEELTFINKLIEERNVAKLNKDYKRADEIRDELKKMNIIIKDTREGTMFERI